MSETEKQPEEENPPEAAFEPPSEPPHPEPAEPAPEPAPPAPDEPTPAFEPPSEPPRKDPAVEQTAQVEELETKLEAEASVSKEAKPVKEEPPPREVDHKHRRSSVRTPITIDPGAKKQSLAPESFMPDLDRRGSRRISLAADVKRKSRFGMLSSKARMVLGSIYDIKGNVVESYDRRGPRYQNTYKLESDNPFNPEKVDKILREVMNEVIDNLQYDPEKCASAAKTASMQIRGKVKQLEFDRYKLVCIVTIGEKNSQDVYATCRFLWDPEKDRYSYYSLENPHVYAIAYCFGLYYE